MVHHFLDVVQNFWFQAISMYIPSFFTSIGLSRQASIEGPMQPSENSDEETVESEGGSRIQQ